jgi:hypothetical protein
MSQAFDTPILLLIFNRPTTTQRVFDRIRERKPSKLFIAADGPRPEVPGDASHCEAARAIATHADWPCEIMTLFREENLGCRKAVSSSIDWFFSQVEEGIILEDDCLPESSFFLYCSELLQKYRSDARIMMINGTNIAGSWNTPNSYTFSKYGSVWGWATWKRAWDHYDVDMKSWSDSENQRKVRQWINNPRLWKDKKWAYDRAATKTTWDYQWEYATLLHNGLTLVPCVNLIENIGFSKEATHTVSEQSMRVKTQPLTFPLIHPTKIETNPRYDKYFIKKIFNPKSIPARILNKLKTMGTWYHTSS